MGWVSCGGVGAHHPLIALLGRLAPPFWHTFRQQLAKRRRARPTIDPKTQEVSGPAARAGEEPVLVMEGTTEFARAVARVAVDEAAVRTSFVDSLRRCVRKGGTHGLEHADRMLTVTCVQAMCGVRIAGLRTAALLFLCRRLQTEMLTTPRRPSPSPPPRRTCAIGPGPTSNW